MGKRYLILECRRLYDALSTASSDVWYSRWCAHHDIPQGKRDGYDPLPIINHLIGVLLGRTDTVEYWHYLTYLEESIDNEDLLELLNHGQVSQLTAHERGYFLAELER